MAIWKDISLRKKLLTGFGGILALLLAASLWAIFGISGIVSSAKEVITGNEIRATLVQKEVDHLNWVAQVNEFLTDESITTLDVQTDPHKCAFGQWYYSDQRREVEGSIPSLKPLLAAIEAPHTRLHESAVALSENYVQVDMGMAPYCAR
jgi:methyl-accepting chemotaxis protein